MTFWDQSWNFSNVAPELHQICTFFATIKKLSIVLESPHFPTFSAKSRREMVMENQEMVRKSHGKIFVNRAYIQG